MKLARDEGMLERVRDKTPAVGDRVSQLPGKELVIPGVLGLAGAVAAKKAPDLLQGLGRSIEGKKTRRLPVQRWTDVAVPIDKAYDAWTNFDEFPNFMHRVLDVEQRGRNRVRWQEKIWFSKRHWEGEITDRRKNDRIVWKTVSGMSHRGIVSFHRLDANLTRVMVDLEFEPSGMVEKMASGLRFVKRAVQADLARYKAFVEMQNAKGIEYRQQNGSRSKSSRNARARESARRQREDGRKTRRERSRTS